MKTLLCQNISFVDVIYVLRIRSLFYFTCKHIMTFSNFGQTIKLFESLDYYIICDDFSTSGWFPSKRNH